ncbi:MAG: 50S ribosomal protein L4 [Caldiserica bacterium]|nr:50S ribosomal protein L4 [Caldisericota bacterium]
MKGSLVNIKSNSIEEIDLPDRFFSRDVNKYLLYLAVKRHLANMRRGTADTQERGDVDYSTRKVRPQKGTGRSRQGARTSNIWKGGAVVFGPHPRDFSLKMNKKERKNAIFSALSSRMKDGDIYIVEGFNASGKTKEFRETINKVSEISKKNLGTILFVFSEENGEIERASRNLHYCNAINFRYLNAYALTLFDSIVISKEVVEGIERWWPND